MEQRVPPEVGVDERRLHAQFGHAQPQAHKLIAVLHEEGDHVARGQALRLQEVGHAVRVIVQLPEGPVRVCALEDQGCLVRVALDCGSEQHGDRAPLP